MAATLSTQSLVSAWEQFLTDYYKLRIEEAALNYPETRSVDIDYNDLDRRDPNLAQYLLDHPRASIQSSEEALRLIEVPVEPRPALRVRVKNIPRQNRYQVRKLRAEHLGKFVAVEGLIKKVVEVRPKLKDATFQCQRCGAVFNVQQEDQILNEPKSCDEGQGGCGRDGPFKLLTEESKFIDSQKVEIQESHEDLRGGAQPERITVYLEEDLTGKVYPGDSVVINGVFRAQQRRQGSLKLAEFIKVIDCVSYEVQQMEFEEIEIKAEDIPEIEQISKTADVYKTIRDSFAPEIYGMEKIKDALILSLFGGVAKEFKDGTRIRGDIHCLLVGDPGVAKCMRGDAIIALATGERPTIASLVEEALRGERTDVDDGWWAPLRVPVYSMDTRGRMITKYTSRAWKRTAPTQMVRLRTRSGRSVEVTPTHPLFMTDGVSIHPREAGKIQVGEHVAVPRRLPTIDGRPDLTQILTQEETKTNSNVDVVPVYPRFFRDLREGLGLTQAECGIPRGTWLGLERGEKHATRGTFETMAQAVLEVAMDKAAGRDAPYLEAAQRMATLATSDLFWDEIVHIEAVASSEPYVYDLEVPDTHNFMANGIVNHNSQLLRYLSKLSPRSIYTSGKGTSAAGLTATAVRDEFGEGQWSLEAGALVLADKGIACLHPDSEVLIGGVPRRVADLFDETKASPALTTSGGRLELSPLLESTVNFNLQSLESKNALATMVTRRTVRVKMCRVRLSSGFELRVTPDHLALSGRDLDWHPMGKLQIGHPLVAIQKIPTHHTPVPILDILSDDQQVLREEAASLKLSEVTPSLAYAAGLASESGIPHAIAAWVAKDGLANLLRLDQDSLTAFIAGVFDHDGKILTTSSSKAGADPSVTLEFSFSSDRTENLRFLLALRRLDVFARLRTKSGRYAIQVRGGSDVGRLGAALAPYSARAKDIPARRARFAQHEQVPAIALRGLLEAVRPRPNELLDEAEWSHFYDLREDVRPATKAALRRVADSVEALLSQEQLERVDALVRCDYALDHIESIHEETYDGYVYDLRVPDGEHFLCDGVAVHNCIDELDKMDENDQSAMHQAMEQQEISISKAGISATLKSRCAVIGAANPKTGRFDDFAPIVQQINMPPPLLSRFDLIFGLRDRPNKEQDERIARHILGTHRAGEVHMARKRKPDGSFTEAQEKSLMARIEPVVGEQTLRKYVAYAKRNFYPVLTEEAANSINSFYQTLRNQASGTIGITPRQIEAIIRLAEASAKIRLSTDATQEDAARAISIFTEFLKTVGWNEEAGTIDIDIIAAGASSSQQERMRKVLELIRRLNGEAGGDGAKLGDVLEQAQASAPPIPADKVEEAIRILKERGSIFQPRGDRYAPL